MKRPIEDEVITPCLDAGQELYKTRIYLDELEKYANYLESKVKEDALLHSVSKCCNCNSVLDEGEHELCEPCERLASM